MLTVSLILAVPDQKQKLCNQHWGRFFMEISAGAECLSNPCSRPCQRSIERTLEACKDQKVPHTLMEFNEAGVTSMREAGPSSCDWQFEGVGGRRLLEAEGNFEEAAGGGADPALQRTTPPRAAKGAAVHPDDIKEQEERTAAAASATAAVEDPGVAAAEDPGAAAAGETANSMAASGAPTEAQPEQGAPGGELTQGAEGHSACEDVDEDCAEWAENGECHHNPVFMMEHCMKSCGACGSDASAPPPAPLQTSARGCDDEYSRTECQAWAEAGECDSNADFMHHSCRRTCGLCDAEEPAA